MNFSSDKQCQPCKNGMLALSKQQAATLLADLPQWQLVTLEHIPCLKRKFIFKDFVSAMVFTNQLAELAEQQGHHPAILTEWGSVTVSWWTHKIKGLHENDFIMAHQTDKLIV